jgi:hypothetical protein
VEIATISAAFTRFRNNAVSFALTGAIRFSQTPALTHARGSLQTSHVTARIKLAWHANCSWLQRVRD